MPVFDKQPNKVSIRYELQAALGYIKIDEFVNLLTADADGILNDQALDGSTVAAFLAQPDYARNVTIVASDATTDDVVINGTNIRGEVISETLALNGTTPVVGSKAFKTITSIVLPTVGATTMDVGWGVKIGFERKPAGNGVMDAQTDDVRETTFPTVATGATIEANTFTTNTAPNGTRDFRIIYVSKEIYKR